MISKKKRMEYLSNQSFGLGKSSISSGESSVQLLALTHRFHLESLLPSPIDQDSISRSGQLAAKLKVLWESR
jgi:hypothetical protein